MPEVRIEWEALFVLRAGAALAPLRLAEELFAMQPMLAHHQVRGAEVRAALADDLAWPALYGAPPDAR